MPLKHNLIYPAGTTAACHYAADCLARYGIPIVDHPTPEVTHLLLDIPSFQPNGALRDGTDPARLLERIPESVTIIGGNLNISFLKHYRVFDLLQQEDYLVKNAAITADCALRLAAPLLDCTFQDAPVLIVGWGRIGKCLGRLLKGLNVPVTVAARKAQDRALLQVLGYQAIHPTQILPHLSQFRILFSTAPAPVLGADITEHHPCIHMMDLASSTGLEGSQVIHARGLPGQYAPKSSGRLIADTVLQIL